MKCLLITFPLLFQQGQQRFQSTTLLSTQFGDVVVLTVDPGTANEATFIGEKDTGNQFINCVWTEGNTGVGHSSGATIIDYDSATHHYAQTKGILQFANQDGSLQAQPIRDALGLAAATANGWEVFPHTMQVSSGYNKGNRSFDITVPNQDVTSLLSPGMRLKLQRGVSAPTQSADLEQSSSQYAENTSPSGITFTDDFTVEAWVKPESYSQGYILSRFDNVTDSRGWYLRFNATGTIQILGKTSTNEYSVSYEALPLNEWTHVAATLDLSGNVSKMYFNGQEVEVEYTTGSQTALVQDGDLCIGSITDGTSTFDGKIADVRLWSAVRTETEIQG